MFGFIFTFLLLITAPSLYANGIAPEFFLYWGAFYTAITFTIGLALEYICMCILARVQTSHHYWRALLCTATMNLASTIAGTIIRGPFAILYVIFLSKISNLITISSNSTTDFLYNALYIFGIYLIYVIINTIIEAPIAGYFFPKTARKRVWSWVFVANCLSMAVITIMFISGFFNTFSRYLHF